MGEAGSPATSREPKTPLMVRNEDIGNDRFIPQLFTSVPALNEAASYLAQTTSLLTRCFTDYSVEYSPRDSGHPIMHAQELVTFSSGESAESLDSDCPISSRSRSTFSDPSTSATASPLVHDEIRRTSSEGPSQNTSVIVPSTHSGQNGISLFQGLIERARRTVRGSADDIGWMQRDPGMSPVEDGTEKFMEILDNIRHGLHKLPNSMVYLLVPGSEHDDGC